MADIQKEKGYTPVAHELIEITAQYKFNATQLRLILMIWRYTYGFHRKDHEFSLSFLQAVTKLPESSVKRETTNLIKAKVLLVTQKETSSTPRKISFNKNYEQWNIPKSGDSVDEQLELFPNFEGSNLNPQDNNGGVKSDTPEGSHLVPQEHVLRGQIRPPYKDIRSLKISIKDINVLFDIFYEIYPRKMSKKKAIESWHRLCKQEDFKPHQAIEYTKNFAETCKLLKTEMKYIPLPATYLNQKRYEDYSIVDPEGLASTGGNDKLSDNMEFLKNQLGGAAGDGRRSGLTNGSGMRSLSE